MNNNKNKRKALKWICILVLTLSLLMCIGSRENNVQSKPSSYEETNKKSSNDGSGITPLSIDALLTREEKEYIANNPIIKAATIDGIAPFAFTDKNGNIQGIFQRVLEKIGDISGLEFECIVYDSYDELFSTNADLIYAISPGYAPDNILLSEQFLETKTILYMNESVNPDELDNKLYAAVKGLVLPEGIKEENTIYYNTVEECLNAVASGKAHYSYGNAYSVAYYTLRNNYHNIVTVPIGMEPREYCMAVVNNDEILLSIINKSLSLIDTDQMNNLILEEASHIEHQNTLPLFFQTYGRQVGIIMFILFIILVLSQLYILRLNKNLIAQNKKYEVLSQISKEYRYEYYVKEKRLQLAEEFNELFYTEESLNEVANILKKVLSKPNIKLPGDIIKLPLPDGQVKSFKLVKSNLLNYWGKTKCIIGKLIDVSEEVAKIKELIIKAQIDELTGLYNSATTKALINERLARKGVHNQDIFILIDCDGFKNINDSSGHLAGDKVLQDLAFTMKQTFRNTDILGRLGGDEFCVYMKDITSLDSVVKKCEKFINHIENTINFPNFSVSIGIALVKGKETYEDIFLKADIALYQGKRNGKAQVVIYDKQN